MKGSDRGRRRRRREERGKRKERRERRDRMDRRERKEKREGRRDEEIPKDVQTQLHSVRPHCLSASLSLNLILNIMYQVSSISY